MLDGVLDWILLPRVSIRLTLDLFEKSAAMRSPLETPA